MYIFHAMKLLSPEQIRAADQYTIENEPISSIRLMERAAVAFTAAFAKDYVPSNPVVVVCGTGNNGGDGLAIGRLLIEQGYKVHSYVVDRGGHHTNDFGINYERLSKLVEIGSIDSSTQSLKIPNGAVVIDALFGSGLSRPVEGLHAWVIDSINSSDATVVSVDIASGLFVDQPVGDHPVIEADRTFSFQLPKLAFMLPQNVRYVGAWQVLDIGLDPDFIEQQETDYHLIDRKDIVAQLKRRNRFSHKGNYGHAILLAGSKGKMGAAILAAKACLRSGVGLLTLQIPECGYEIIQSAVPEAMVVTDITADHLSAKGLWPKFDVMGIGPGIGQHADTGVFLRKSMTETKAPMALDADALNILSQHPDWLEFVPKNSILTPHPKEFSRLTGDAQDDFHRLNLLQGFSQKYQVNTVLKGAYSGICTPKGQVFFNQTGNPGMATAGSGDVLTGIITGLLAQGYDPVVAARMGVFLHGMAGDLAIVDVSEESMVASDIINYLGATYLKLHTT